MWAEESGYRVVEWKEMGGWMPPRKPVNGAHPDCYHQDRYYSRERCDQKAILCFFDHQQGCYLEKSGET
jgi:hypothetical protein